MAGNELVPQTKVFKKSEGRGWGVQCTSNRRDGVRCTRWAIVGGYVCPKHGGQLPTVKLAAKARLRALAPIAVRVLEEEMMSGNKSATRLRAARFVLKYSGITPANVRAESKSRGERAALPQGQGPPDSVDEEIDRLLGELRNGEAPGLVGGEGQAAIEAPPV